MTDISSRHESLARSRKATPQRARANGSGQTSARPMKAGFVRAPRSANRRLRTPLLITVLFGNSTVPAPLTRPGLTIPPPIRLLEPHILELPRPKFERAA